MHSFATLARLRESFFFLRLKIMNRIDKILRSLSYINNAPTKQTKNFTKIL